MDDKAQDHADGGENVENGDINPERTLEFGVDERAKTEARMVARRLRDELGRGPNGKKYLATLDLMKNESGDLTDPADAKKFQRALGLAADQLRLFQQAFLRDLSKAFRRLGVEDYESAEQVINPGLKSRVLEGRVGVCTPTLGTGGTHSALKDGVSLPSMKVAARGVRREIERLWLLAA